ncbi:hypothetical protein GSUB_15325 [Geoalkalibacter subterraneus]|uniref:Polysaccharide biosynthesis protein n=1 Tax=Geoalkalibacter subterraneus TaxID=483547 RepID=A0A0B5FV81_9BACT|nr:hypothetical protein GSUB_15325 [Geoalkalibacter subterraneus]
MARAREGVRRLLPKNKFARSVSVLVGGTTGAQALMVLASPLLTRLYTPEDFGLLAVYSGLLALFAVIASLRYELAIPLPESNTEAANVLVLSLLVVLLMTGISVLMVLLAGQQIAHALDTPKLAQFVWLLPIGVLLSGIYKVFNYWAVRTKAFGDIARTRISQTLATLAVQLFGYKLGGLALLFGQAGGQGMGSLRLARSAIKHQEFNTWSWGGVWLAAKRYKQFPLFSTWSGLFNAAGTQLPPLMFAALFSAGAAGLYALASRILRLPMTVLGGAIGQVYFSDLAKAKQSGGFSTQVEKAAEGLLKVSLPAAAAFMLLAPEIFGLVFGTDWRLAGDIARWMTPWILFQFISSPLSVVYFVLEKERLGFFFQVSMFLVRLSVVFLGYIYLDFMGTLIAFSLVSAFCYISYCYSIIFLSGAKFKSFSLVILTEVIKVGVALISAVLSFSYWGLYPALVVSILLLLVFYIPRFREFYIGHS